jgi:hypothetical protein
VDCRELVSILDATKKLLGLDLKNLVRKAVTHTLPGFFGPIFACSASQEAPN